MTIISQLASSLGRNDEQPNLDLAAKITKTSDQKAIKELIENLNNNKNKDIQSDCIKTLYEIGNLSPSLIAPYIEAFIRLLNSRNNRLQWGAMTALNSITLEIPDAIFTALPQLAAAVDKGSVITRDNYVNILIKLCSLKKYAASAFDLLDEQLRNCPTNQLPMYAENALPHIPPAKKTTFIQTLTSRLNEFEKESKRKRIEKVLKKA